MAEAKNSRSQFFLAILTKIKSEKFLQIKVGSEKSKVGSEKSPFE